MENLAHYFPAIFQFGWGKKSRQKTKIDFVPLLEFLEPQRRKKGWKLKGLMCA